MTTGSIQERVNEICTQLYGNGEKISVRIVLSMLPDVSSTATVHKYVTAWKNEVMANERSLYEKLGFSNEFTQMFMREISRFSAEAEMRYKGIAEDAAEQRDQAVSSLGMAEDRLAKQNAVVEQQAKQIAELEKELMAVRQQAANDIDANKQANAAVTDELRKKLEGVEVDKKALADTAETLRTELAKAQILVEQAAEAKVERNEVLAKLEKLQTEHNAQATELAKVTAELTGAQNLLSERGDSIQALRAQESKASKKSEQLETQLEAQQVVTKELAQKVTALQRENGYLSERHAERERYIKALETDPAKSEN
ncbi:hypothetical protein L4C36_20705 [Photobacterium japonica]|uniref:DNA-binding protein n=1 Tax=Photobacterium japonica TaxID=2910235 RepID=UPI003D113543